MRLQSIGGPVRQRLARRVAGLAVVLALFIPGSLLRAGLWITGYYPQYEQNQMPVSQIDFATVTHVIHFCLEAEAGGTINSADNGLTPAACANFVATVHDAGRKALICVGGAGSEAGFEGATTAANLPAFISSLAGFMSSNHYDGVDIDWEPLSAADGQQYTNFINALRSALNGYSPSKLLTVAAPAYPVYGDPPAAEFTMFASIQNQFDQINIMTYDLSGPYPGWVTWFNSPIYDGGYTFPSTGGLVPSVKGAVGNFVNNGVSPGKLAVGLPFYGYIWSGVTQPREAWSGTNTPTFSAFTYRTIVSTYYQSNCYHWDTNAQAAYLSLTNAQPADDMFISYDDTLACQTKVSYARNRGLGGIMIWELSQDYFANQSAGQQSPLVQALSQSLATPRILSAEIQGGSVAFSFSSLPLAQYRILWTSNLNVGAWQTLTNNIPGTGGSVWITDPVGIGAGARFYRVQTPP
jgi:chitinase